MADTCDNPRSSLSRATPYLGAEKWKKALFILPEQEASLDQSANEHRFEFLLPYPNLIPSPALQRHRLLSWPFQGCFPLTRPCAFPCPTFNKRSHQPYSITQFSPHEQPCSAKLTCTHELGNLTHYFQTFKKGVEFHSIRNKIQKHAGHTTPLHLARYADESHHRAHKPQGPHYLVWWYKYFPQVWDNATIFVQ